MGRFSNAGFSAVTPFTELVQGDFGYEQVNVAAQLNDPNSLFRVIARMIAIRKQHAAFGGGSLEWIETGNPSVSAYLRELAGDAVVVVQNQPYRSSRADPADYQKTALDLFTNYSFSLGVSLELRPYSYLWLQL